MASGVWWRVAVVVGCACAVGATAPGALTNTRVSVPHVVAAPYGYSSEDTNIAAPDAVAEVRLRCGGDTQGHNRVNRPVFCEYETWDSCGNRFGGAAQVSLFTAGVATPAGAALPAALISDVVHGGGVGRFRFHFTPPEVGVYTVALTYTQATPALTAPPRAVLVVVSSQAHACSTAPRVVSTREEIQAHMKFHGLADRVVTSHHKPLPAADPPRNAMKQRLNAKPDPSQLPRREVPPRFAAGLPNPLFPHNDPPRFDRYPHVRDGFCQVLDKPV